MTTDIQRHDGSLLALARMLRKRNRDWRLHTDQPGVLVIPASLRGPDCPHQIVTAAGPDADWLWFDSPSERSAICPANNLEQALKVIAHKLETTARKQGAPSE